MYVQREISLTDRLAHLRNVILHTARQVIATVGQALGNRADMIEAHPRAQTVAALLVVLNELREFAVVQAASGHIVRYATVGI